MKQYSIAIDGPAAAGKSTVAKIVASKLGYLYIDTGAMYRAITFEAIRNNVNLEDEASLQILLAKTDIDLRQYDDNNQHVFVNNENVTEEIRTHQVTNNVSIVAKHKVVREEMLVRQRALGERGGVVMDGRDIGTHVLPDAEIKVFLLASVEKRAQRRHAENLSKGFESDLDKLKQEIALRDKIDSERESAPLRKANDAKEIDTTSLTIEEVVDKIMTLVTERD
ncbi:(d)CMP kinase [Sutcliffiella rhizosphaerae]|uniref:Cytidylate kinase n=1 Tax=Sutcliffiella rhizosphaerae TaxID=2880967 RepID=A0ABN8AE23_9BACI|nr:(d)CMP kinase [Sutcliffiella rhizosphaerae]CAG9623514.1 Cytidylate kinase [Sutcliffiella rhizosphaerae]